MLRWPAGVFEAVPNFSEGRDRAILDALAAGPLVLDLHADADHHRCVLTMAAGDAARLAEAAVEKVALAVERIDLRRHAGLHPRVGAADFQKYLRSRWPNAGGAALGRSAATEGDEENLFPGFAGSPGSGCRGAQDLPGIGQWRLGDRDESAWGHPGARGREPGFFKWRSGRLEVEGPQHVLASAPDRF